MPGSGAFWGRIAVRSACWHEDLTLSGTTQDQQEFVLRVAVDVGGTFTDVVVFDDVAQSIALAKAHTTPRQFAEGIEHGLAKAAVHPPGVDQLIHGSTIAINAILQRRGARTALLTTRGFRDVYEIGRINRPDAFNLFFRKHRPLVPRELIFEINERVLADGTVEMPLDEAQARRVVDGLVAEGVDAVAVVLLHSYRFPEHERKLVGLIRQAAPSVFVSASHELVREYREYERTSTTAANAYVGPAVSGYLGALEGRLKDARLRGSLMLMQSSGGLYDVATARSQCLQMLESGPAGGVVGAMRTSQSLGVSNAIAFDVGGTTAKACVIQGGKPNLAVDYFVGGYNEGLAVRLPVLDIVEVGTGGGSIGWIDAGGALHVGPESAGADPGPVGYARGGVQPTVTDASAVRGELDPDRFLGGEMRFDLAAAASAIEERIAHPLGLSLERAATGMLEIATTAMANAVRAVTTARGIDPRDFILIAYGGGGPLRATDLARELSIQRVVIPQAPANFSALGMLLADLRRDYVRTWFERLDGVSMAALDGEFAALEREGADALTRMGGFETVTFERSLDMRYVGQEHAVTLAIPRHLGERPRAAIKRLFDEAHEQRYSHSAPEEPAEIVNVRVSAIGVVPKPELPRLAEGAASPAPGAERGERGVRFDYDRPPVPTRVFERSRLLAGNVIRGPAAIEEAATVTLVAPGDRLEVDGWGNLMIEVGVS
jgi:N-methylhydantoinase A